MPLRGASRTRILDSVPTHEEGGMSRPTGIRVGKHAVCDGKRMSYFSNQESEELCAEICLTIKRDKIRKTRKA
jgi:hypothetical protein